MPNYLVSYDLDQPSKQNYTRLESRLAELKAVRVLSFQWLFNHHGDIFAVEKDLLSCINTASDRILIVPIEQGRNTWNRLLIEDSDFKAAVARL